MEKGRDEFNPYMTKDIARIILKIRMLWKISNKEIYSYALLKDIENDKISEHLKKDGSNIKNDIYNTMKALEKSRYITMRARIENGKLKKYYKITEKGRKALKESRELFLNSMKEIKSIVS